MVKGISADKNHALYQPDYWRYTPFLDGAKIDDCITANVEIGYAVVYERDEKGQLVVEGENLKTKTLRGKVTLARLVA